MTRMWGGRFAGATDESFFEWQKSLPNDQLLLAADLAGSAAWAEALEGAGVLTAAETKQIGDALQAIAAEHEARGGELHPTEAEDVHSYVEERLTLKVGALAKKLHAGRSRNDQVATDLKLFLRAMVAALDERLVALSRALVDLADETAELAIPGYTHLQRAQPVTAGHHALAYVEMFARDRERLADAELRMATCPLGSGALAGTAFAIDRDALAANLGFEAGPTANSLDAVSDRDHLAEVLFACALVSVHLSRLAEDWIFYSSHEAGFLELSDAIATGSSLMPQKKNPDGFELLRGQSGRAIGELTGLLATLKGLPLAYDRDLQEDKECLASGVAATLMRLQVAEVLVRNVRYVPERCRAAAARGGMNATDLADLLVRAGVSFRDAHERAGAAVRAALERNVELEGLPKDVVAKLLPELARLDLVKELSVESVLARRDVEGGTAPKRVRAAVRHWKERFEEEAAARGEEDAS